MRTSKDLSLRAYSSLIEFFRLESAGGILLVAASIIALFVANSSLAVIYDQLLHFPIRIGIADYAIDKSLAHWINDGLMAIFFLMVGLELKRELIEGQFADRKQIMLPAICALGGMLVPMAIYAAFNWQDPVAIRGVAIPAATDIAFALGVLSLLGSRVPVALKLLLTAIAVADDLGAIIIIAVFYTSDLSVLALGLAMIAIFCLWLLNYFKVQRLAAYLIIGLVLWVAVLKSGVHATLAGVILGLSIPLGGNGEGSARPSEKLEHFLHPWVAYLILPIFAFANAGVSLKGFQLSNLLDAVPLGIVMGLVVGKQVGIFGTAYFVHKMKWLHLPEGLNLSMLWGMSLLCGIGFTMSLFIGSLAFAEQSEALQVSYRLGILLASFTAAIIAFVVLYRQLGKNS